MRVSVDSQDPGHDQWLTAQHFGNVVRVYLDGVEQALVLTADDREGLIVRCSEPVRYDQHTGRPVEEVIRGKVSLEFFKA